ncbi:MAG: MmcQ/YjbR family DNA-binding protein [Pelosinus sp.]|nr:MmcQ/YjbR family DNA-binding protein [Pelosinus sp.]
MDSKKLFAYCLTKKGAFEDYPFGPDVIVVKVATKIFALLSNREGVVNLSLKCSPELAEILRCEYQSIIPGYHLNKRHWNTLLLDGSIPETEIRSLIDHSYDLVAKSLSRKERQKLIEG